MWEWSFGAGDWIWMSVMLAVVWLPIVLVAIWLLRGTEADRSRPPSHEREDPRDVARRAYARGELSREQFQQVVTDLSAPMHGGCTTGTHTS